MSAGSGTTTPPESRLASRFHCPHSPYRVADIFCDEQWAASVQREADGPSVNRLIILGNSQIRGCGLRVMTRKGVKPRFFQEVGMVSGTGLEPVTAAV